MVGGGAGMWLFARFVGCVFAVLCALAPAFGQVQIPSYTGTYTGAALTAAPNNSPDCSTETFTVTGFAVQGIGTLSGQRVTIISGTLSAGSFTFPFLGSENGGILFVGLNSSGVVTSRDIRARGNSIPPQIATINDAFGIQDSLSYVTINRYGYQIQCNFRPPDIA
jgi:hypothetical protein